MTAQGADSINASSAGSIALGPGVTVNRLGFGAMRITGPGIWGPPADTQEAVRVLRRALELNVNFIDTADSYGPSVSEELIARALHPYAAGLVIATKGGLTRPGPDVWNRNGQPQHLREACEGSLRRLKLEQIGLYQLHAPDPGVPYEASVGELVRLKEAGKIRLIGLSNVSVAQIKLAQTLTPIASVQNRYNIADRGSDKVLDYCREQGIAFIPWAPLGSSRLAQGSGSGKALARLATRHEMSAGQAVLAWLLARSPVILPIPGTSSVAHLEENVAAGGVRFTPEELRELG
jgi:aryl-alcohol dehydrogenase-like predicted oxidoreductase